MTSSDETKSADPQSGGKKGGGDGDAKNPKPKPKTDPKQDETASAKNAPQPNTKAAR